MDTELKKYHAKESNTDELPTWEFVEQTTPPSEDILLARVLIGKVKSVPRLETVLRAVPIRAGQQPGWNCVSWVQDALEGLAADAGAMGASSNLDWTAVRGAAMKYVDQKAAEHRYDGRAPVGQFDMARPATFDLVLGKEVVP